MSTSHYGKKVYITGASRGIGRALAGAFRDAGAEVIGTRTGTGAHDDRVCTEWFTADFTDMAQIDHCVGHVRECGPDVLINNAGINRIAPFAEIHPDDFLAIQQVNVFTPFRLCQAAIPAMVRQGWGRIVNVSSIWGKISKELRASYSTSKFGLDGMTSALAAEHAADGILANCVAPGFFDTEMTRRVLGEERMRQLAVRVPAQRVGQVKELASFVLWLASEENTYISGQNIAIDGGFTRV